MSAVRRRPPRGGLLLAHGSRIPSPSANSSRDDGWDPTPNLGKNHRRPDIFSVIVWKNGFPDIYLYRKGGLAQLARAFAWHARGHRFEPDILHTRRLFIERRTAVFYRPRRLKRIGAADPKVAQPRNSCGSPYAYTNGYFTTSAFINLSRITTAMTVPIAAYSLLTYPKPMPHLSMGDMVPDVTWPISSPSRFASL